MRYRKGSIAFSEMYDLPLLLLVRNAGYVKDEQLLTLAGYEKSRSARTRFLWRTRRLVNGGLIALLADRVEGHKVYSITRKGLQKLETLGHSLYSIHSEMDNISEPAKMMHSLELNDIRLTLSRHQFLDSWLSGLEICSENLLSEDKYVKDYDGMAVLRIGGRRVQCAIEYERTTKSLPRYAQVRQALSQERIVDAILYIVCQVERLFLVAEQLSGAHPGILFVSASAFFRFGLDAYSMRTSAIGGSLEDLLAQLPGELPANEFSVSA